MKYKAYEFILWQHVDGGYSTYWRIRDPSAGYYYHRVGGPAHVEYGPDGTIHYQTWDVNGTMYFTDAEYQKALKAWLG